MNRAFRVVFVGLRIAEVGKYAIAHVPGDVTFVTLNGILAGVLIGAIDVPKLLFNSLNVKVT